MPYDLLWNKSNTVLTQMLDNPQHAVSLDPTANFVLNGEMPYTTSQSIADYLNFVHNASQYSSFKTNYLGYDRALCSVKLLEYLGYGNYESFLTSGWPNSPLMADLNQNLFGLLAYQKYIQISIVIVNGKGFHLLLLMLIIWTVLICMLLIFILMILLLRIIICLISVIVIGRKICFMVFFRINNMEKLLLLRLLRM